MHKSLYEIQADYANITAQLLDNDGEITEEMELALTISQDELKAKAEAYALRILDFYGQCEILKAEIQRLAARAKRFDSTAERLRGIIKAAMIQFNTPKIQTTKITLSLRKSDKLELPDGFADSILAFTTIEPKLNQAKIEAAMDEAVAAGAPAPSIPAEELLQYLKITAAPDPSKIKAALKEGTNVGDCIIVENKTLQIK